MAGTINFCLEKGRFQTTGSTDQASLLVIRRMEKTRNEEVEKRKETRKGLRERKRKKRASKDTSDKMPREPFFNILQLNHPISED